MSADTDLYRRRELEERKLAAHATNPRIKAIHLELAEVYAQLGGRTAITPSFPTLEQSAQVCQALQPK